MKDEGVLVSIVAVSCNFIGMSVDIEKFCGKVQANFGENGRSSISLLCLSLCPEKRRLFDR
jgi:hypothetical protein